MSANAVSALTLLPLRIPLRQGFRHAAATRDQATPLLLQVRLHNGVVGWGEAHPRPYVTGETADSVAAAMERLFAPALMTLRPGSIAEAFEAAHSLPFVDADGTGVSAARAAVEVALLDAYSRSFGKSLETLGGWLGDPMLGAPGSLPRTRVSGVVSAETPARVRRSILKMRLFGLRDFKLKVGDPEDDARVRSAAAALARGLRNGSLSLRVDANGGWNLEEAHDRLERWRDVGLACVEQPLARTCGRELAKLARASHVPIMADESLITAADAETLIADGAAAWFNIRIAKNGGLIPAIRLAMTARKAGLGVQLGCLVGETSVLSSAGRWFLHLVPGVRFAEVCYGGFLLAGDVARRPVQFGFRGRLRAPAGPGLGVTVEPSLLERYADSRPVTIAL